MSSEHYKVITIDDLRVGMLVTKLDIAWLDSPFLSHTRAIKDMADIQALRQAGVKTVTIDLDRGLIAAPEPEAPPPPAPIAEPENVMPTEVATTQPPPSNPSFDRELQVAVKLRSEIKKAVERLTGALELSAPVNVKELVPLVDSTLDSLERNDQALMSLVHLSRKAHKLADHVFGTFCLVLNLALLRKVPASEREQLGLAALLHEAGWTQLPLNLIGKHTPYTAAERVLVQKHTQIGNQILSHSELPELTRRIVAEHHELLDGSGYPNGLRREQIHPLSQFLTVVDTYEERVHQLTDEPGMTPTTALRSLFLDAERGALSPDLVASLINLVGIYPPTAAVVLNTGERGVVRQRHPEAPLQPLVAIHYDPAGHILETPLLVDLRQVADNRRAITGAFDPIAPSGQQWRRLVLTEEQLRVG